MALIVLPAADIGFWVVDNYKYAVLDTDCFRITHILGKELKILSKTFDNSLVNVFEVHLSNGVKSEIYGISEFCLDDYIKLGSRMCREGDTRYSHRANGILAKLMLQKDSLFVRKIVIEWEHRELDITWRHGVGYGVYALCVFGQPVMFLKAEPMEEVRNPRLVLVSACLSDDNTQLTLCIWFEGANSSGGEPYRQVISFTVSKYGFEIVDTSITGYARFKEFQVIPFTEESEGQYV